MLRGGLYEIFKPEIDKAAKEAAEEAAKEAALAAEKAVAKNWRQQNPKTGKTGVFSLKNWRAEMWKERLLF